MGESAPFWRFSAASYPDLEQAMAVDAVLRTAKRKPSEKSETSYGVCYLAKPYMPLVNMSQLLHRYLL